MNCQSIKTGDYSRSKTTGRARMGSGLIFKYHSELEHIEMVFGNVLVSGASIKKVNLV
jgi:hypothetical protein